MTCVYLSPHLDDAVLSCGGIIHRQRALNEPVLVVTLFAGESPGQSLSSFAQEQHGYWGNPSRPMRLRRSEDLVALSLLDAQVRHLDYLDAVYRTDTNGRWLYTNVQALFDEVQAADPLAQDGGKGMADRLAGLIPLAGRPRVYAPLAIGRHVDHQITHRVGRQLLALGYAVAFYEDYPYAEQPGAAEAALAAAGAEGWRAEALPLDPADLSAKVSAAGYYRTQLGILFHGAEAMPGRVWTFAATRSTDTSLAERIWWP